MERLTELERITRGRSNNKDDRNYVFQEIGSYRRAERPCGHPELSKRKYSLPSDRRMLVSSMFKYQKQEEIDRTHRPISRISRD